MYETPLALAVIKHHFAIANYLLSHNADINGRGHISFLEKGCTPLIYICSTPYWKKRITAVKYLVEKGANIYIEDTRGDSALLLAISEHDVETVKYLVEKYDDASLNKFYDKQTILQYLCYYLGSCSSKDNAKCYIQILDILLSRGVDVNLVHPKYKHTALSDLTGIFDGDDIECKEEMEAAIKMLKERGAIEK